MRPGRSTLLYRCSHAACLADAAFARAVLATYKTPAALPAAAGVPERDAQRVRASLGDAAHISERTQ